MKENGVTVVSLRDGVYLNYKPSDIEIGNHLRFSSQPLVENLVNLFSENRNRIKTSLRRVTDQVVSDLAPDRISLTLLYLYSQYNEFLNDKTLEVIDNPSDFVFWADFKYGFDLVLGTLSVSQSPELHEKVIVKQLSSEAEIWPETKWNQPQKMKEAQDETRYWTAELKKDPSGFKMVDRMVDDLRQGVEIEGLPKRITYEIPEYVLTGADLAAKLYKLCYPLTKGILQQRNNS